jgi:hypothetical protein
MVEHACSCRGADTFSRTVSVGGEDTVRGAIALRCCTGGAVVGLQSELSTARAKVPRSKPSLAFVESRVVGDSGVTDEVKKALRQSWFAVISQSLAIASACWAKALRRSAATLHDALVLCRCVFEADRRGAAKWRCDVVLCRGAVDAPRPCTAPWRCAVVLWRGAVDALCCGTATWHCSVVLCPRATAAARHKVQNSVVALKIVFRLGETAVFQMRVLSKYGDGESTPPPGGSASPEFPRFSRTRWCIRLCTPARAAPYTPAPGTSVNDATRAGAQSRMHQRARQMRGNFGLALPPGGGGVCPPSPYRDQSAASAALQHRQHYSYYCFDISSRRQCFRSGEAHSFKTAILNNGNGTLHGHIGSSCLRSSKLHQRKDPVKTRSSEVCKHVMRQRRFWHRSLLLFSHGTFMFSKHNDCRAEATRIS